VRRRSLLKSAAGLTAGLLSSRAHAAHVGGVHFADNLYVSDHKLKLLGTGYYYYKIFIKVAAAGLYLDERAANSKSPADAVLGNAVLGDIAKRLEMQYFWGVKASDLVAGSTALLNRNVAEKERAKVQSQIDEMFALYQNVSAGDRCAIMYVPGAGTSLLYNGKRLGIVPGAAFAATFFSIWFGEKPLDSGLKRKLLGG
jgi:hypothetical protein